MGFLESYSELILEVLKVLALSRDSLEDYLLVFFLSNLLADKFLLSAREDLLVLM